MKKPPRPESFEKFYYAKVGLGEGCGCAERIIDVHEFNRLAGDPARAGHQPKFPTLLGWLQQKFSFVIRRE